ALLNALAMSLSCFGQYPAKISYVRRPKSRSNSSAIVLSSSFFIASSTKGMPQPPSVNPFVGSSSGPPGPCMTPSTVSWVMAMIFLILCSPVLLVSYLDGRPANGLELTGDGGKAAGVRCSDLLGERFIFAALLRGRRCREGSRVSTLRKNPGLLPPDVSSHATPRLQAQIGA